MRCCASHLPVLTLILLRIDVIAYRVVLSCVTYLIGIFLTSGSFHYFPCRVMASPRRDLDISSSGPDLVPDGSSSETAETVRALRDLVMQQQGQISMLQDGLLAAQRDAAIAMDRASVGRSRIVAPQQSGGSRPPRAGKRSFDRMSGAAPRPTAAPVCSFCRRPGHFRRDCRRAIGACLACGSLDHMAYQCPFGRQRQSVGAIVPSGPFRPPLRIPEHTVGPAQMSADPERGPTPDATTEPAVIPEEAAAGIVPHFMIPVYSC